MPHDKRPPVTNKSELIRLISELINCSIKDATFALNATIQGITHALANGQKVTLVGFGTFEVRIRNARSGRNPQTGKPMQIPASKQPAFKPGKGLKDAVQGDK